MTLSLAALASLCALTAGAAKLPPLQEGDLVFQTSLSGQGEAVALATGSKYTHMGVLLSHRGKLVVFEAVQPVKLTPIEAWIERGDAGHVVVKRLSNAGEVITPEVSAKLRELAAAWVGRSYDLQFRWDDQRLYCSELAYKLFDQAAGVKLGKLQRIGEFQLASPEVQQKIRERFGNGKGELDLDEPAVSPQAIFEDPRLTTVFENAAPSGEPRRK